MKTAAEDSAKVKPDKKMRRASRGSDASKTSTSEKTQETNVPARLEEQEIAIKEFLRSLQDVEENGKDAMRAQLPKLRESRLNVYWTVSSVGVTLRATGKDFAYFIIDQEDCDWTFRMGASLKAAEIFAPRLYSS